jgi:aspartate-semialdehyde dehydrogenase
VTRLAIVEPRTLVGEAIREAMDPLGSVWEAVDLLTVDSENVGGVTELAGQASLIGALDAASLSQADVALFCGTETDPQLIDGLPAKTRAIFVSPAEPASGATAIVDGINLQETASTDRIVSPSGAVIMLAHTLAPLADFGRLEVVAHVLEPASNRDRPGLDELFDQTRAILSMREDRPEEVFGAQLAFNLLPWGGTARDLAQDLSAVLQFPLDVQIQRSQAGVFHCCTIGAYVRPEKDPGLDELRAAVSQDPLVEIYDRPELLGPLAAAASDKILLGPVIASASRGYWIWMAMDNLTASANNALAIARY